jgi:hypothetical protein
MTIPVVSETYHTQCVMFVCNRWWYQIHKGVRRHNNLLHLNNTHYVWYVCLLLVLSCRLSPLGIWYHHLLHTNMTHCVWYVSFTTGIVMSSLSVRYLVSPSVAHEHYTLCMIGFFYYWYCHMTIPVVKETYYTQCVMFVCNRWWYQIPQGERRHDNTSSKRNIIHNVPCSCATDGDTFIMYAQTQHIWNRDDLKEIVEWVNIYLLSISIVNNMYLVSPIVASEH